MAPGASALTPEQAERKFYFILALVMSAIVVAGFSMNLAMGRSTFAVPWPYHLHAAVFFSWLALYVAQNGLIATGNVAFHKRLGMVAFALVPVMVAMGCTIMIVSMRRNGGPFFFDQNEFLISNVLALLLFGGLVFAGLKARRYSGSHRRLMLCAMAILTGPGLGRLLPMPLLIPNGWRILMVAVLIFPAVAMFADWRRHGRVHPALWCGVGAIVGVQVVADIIAYSPMGISLTERVVAGTPGAERPMEAFLPPGFSM